MKESRMHQVRVVVLLVSVTTALFVSGCHRRSRETTPEDVASDRDGRATAGVDDGRNINASSVRVARNDSDCGVGAVYFDYDQYDINERARGQLEQNAQCIRARRPSRVNVTGMADPRGTEEYNLALGDRRAQAATSYVNRLGVDRAILQPRSVGEEYAEGSSEDGWASDRRADFELQ